MTPCIFRLTAVESIFSVKSRSCLEAVGKRTSGASPTLAWMCASSNSMSALERRHRVGDGGVHGLAHEGREIQTLTETGFVKFEASVLGASLLGPSPGLDLTSYAPRITFRV